MSYSATTCDFVSFACILIIVSFWATHQYFSVSVHKVLLWASIQVKYLWCLETFWNQNMSQMSRLLPVHRHFFKLYSITRIFQSSILNTSCLYFTYFHLNFAILGDRTCFGCLLNKHKHVYACPSTFTL